jgi:hypothetical protein
VVGADRIGLFEAAVLEAIANETADSIAEVGTPLAMNSCRALINSVLNSEVAGPAK